MAFMKSFMYLFTAAMKPPPDHISSPSTISPLVIIAIAIALGLLLVLILLLLAVKLRTNRRQTSRNEPGSDSSSDRPNYTTEFGDVCLAETETALQQQQQISAETPSGDADYADSSAEMKRKSFISPSANSAGRSSDAYPGSNYERSGKLSPHDVLLMSFKGRQSLQ